MERLASFERLCLNQATTKKWSLQEAVEGCARAEIPWIGLWRDKIAEIGLKESRQFIRDAGLRVSSIISGGWFSASSAAERHKRLDDSRRAIEEVAELGAGVLVIVGGGVPDRDIDSARKWVAEGIEQLVPYAQSYGVKLGIEPLHPMYAAERSVVVTLAQANELAKRYRPDVVGVIVDVFHVWWDPDLYNQITLAGEHILGFHVSDWIVPTPDLLLGRGMIGDGVIELRRIRKALDAVGYQGPIEVEIFNQSIWDQPGDEVLAVIMERYLEHI
ncbi:sugar phosphate isomerase/epimerase family protein [Aneurinibacillus terranovensis]|uniref:sugar phosphate isomerase/epimerase family protein n=1 Tax=Aneurinibacillus terranovensis TaxID=278991 RepID=UPI000418FAD5|nr:sugar phosphate isomerase/epimerase family protein [Aneurinibacillus terranovensis]